MWVIGRVDILNHVFEEQNKSVFPTKRFLHILETDDVCVLSDDDHSAALAADRLGGDSLGLPCLLLPLLARNISYLSRCFHHIIMIPYNQGSLSGFAMSMIDSLLACCFVANSSNMLLVVVILSVTI